MKRDRTSLVRACLEIVLPDRCRVCSVHLQEPGPESICRLCLERVVYLGSAVCYRCGTVLCGSVSRGQLCGDCLKMPPPWTRCFSLVKYDEPVSALLHQLKYHADTRVLPALTTIIANMPDHDSLLVDAECIVPVPLHRRRLRERGLNQAAVLARLLCRERSAMVRQFILRRDRLTLPQTGLSGVARRKNLRGAFRLMDVEAVKGRRVLLVDDVYTTGTTVRECAGVLRQGGASEIYVLTFARVVVGG